MLMIHLMQSELTVQEFFEDVIYEHSLQRRVKGEIKKNKFLLINAEDFFWKLSEVPNLENQGKTPCIDLNKFLSINKNTHSLKFILANKVKACLTKMSQDEKIMEELENKFEELEQLERQQSAEFRAQQDEEDMLDRIRRCETNFTNRETEQRLKPKRSSNYRPIGTVALDDDAESCDLSEYSRLLSGKVEIKITN